LIEQGIHGGTDGLGGVANSDKGLAANHPEIRLNPSQFESVCKICTLSGKVSSSMGFEAHFANAV
jgi:hypothetical protein